LVNEQAVVVFHDQRVVANAGVMLPGLLAQRLGVEQLVDQTVLLGERRGGANAGRKVMTMLSAMALGADCIEDCDAVMAQGLINDVPPVGELLPRIMREADAIIHDRLARASA
jgi:hypothetical protein